MPIIECSRCHQTADLSLRSHRKARGNTNEFEFRGIVKCSCTHRHEWPLAIKTNDIIHSTEGMMPVMDSANLNENVPEGLKQDIQEAERAHFSQLFKACVVMCRRAIQVGLSQPPHNIADASFTKMLKEAQEKTPPPLSARGFVLVEGIKDYGDAGAHRIEDIQALDARTAIFSTVRVLNELFQP